MIEDVVTSGGQIVTSVQQMRDRGLVVSDAVGVIDCQQDGADNLAATGCALHSVFTMAELERVASSGTE